MKKYFWIVVLISIFSFAASVIFFRSIKASPQISALISPPVTQNQISKPEIIRQVQERPGIPQRLIINKIGVDTNIESVAEDTQGRMAVPKEVNNVGWYQLGFRPGEMGNAVIDGHLDSPTAPAVFYNLTSLTPGDEITVVDGQGEQRKFIVTGIKYYPFDLLPLQEIFGPADKPHLNLITCTGIWDSINKNYSQRVVVYSEISG